MIQLNSQHSLVISRNGQRRSFSFDEVRTDLVHCLRECGSAESWVADHVLLVIQEQILQLHSQGDGVREADIDRLVAGVLMASGYQDVARAYGNRRGQNPLEELSAALKPWDASRLESVLGRSLPLSPGESLHLADQVGTALRNLRFTRVSDVLIREIGIALLCGEGHALPEAIADSEFVLDAAALAEAAGLAGTRWDVSRTLCIRPVSRVFPRACLDVYLDRLCLSLGDSALFELGVLPEIRRLCRRLVEVMRTVRGCVANRRPDAVSVPSHVVVQGLAAVFERHLAPMSPGTRQGCEREIRACFERETTAAPDLDIILTFR